MTKCFNFLLSNSLILREVDNFMINIYDVHVFLENDIDALKARFHFKNREYINFNYRDEDIYYNLVF